jgi:hypothetical protein
VSVTTTEPQIAAPAPAMPFVGAARWRAACLLVTGAALQVVEFVCERPAKTTGARLDWWTAHPDRLGVSQAAGTLAIPFLIGAVLMMWRLARAQSPKLATIAASALMCAMVGLSAIHGLELAASMALKAGHRPAAATILDGTNVGLPGAVLFVLFLGGALLGTVTMDIALWRSRFVPRLAVVFAVAFIVFDFAIGWGVVSHTFALLSGIVLAWAVVTGYAREPKASKQAADIEPAPEAAGYSNTTRTVSATERKPSRA